MILTNSVSLYIDKLIQIKLVNSKSPTNFPDSLRLKYPRKIRASLSKHDIGEDRQITRSD